MPDQEPGRSEGAGQRWSVFTDSLNAAKHRRLLVALGAGLREARLATAIATGDGDVTEARRHLATAISLLTDALQILQPPAVD